MSRIILWISSAQIPLPLWANRPKRGADAAESDGRGRAARCGTTSAERRVRATCKPGSVLDRGRGVTIHLGRASPHASRNLPERTTRKRVASEDAAAPIRSCSRWGLPCRCRCRPRGALLPHPFTLTRRCRHPKVWHPGGRTALCGTFPGVAPAGRYPAPSFRGARTFLPGLHRLPGDAPSGHPAATHPQVM